MSFKNKGFNWQEVESAGTGGGMLPAGGYVAVITKVEDNESGEYLLFTYDIAEGEHTLFFDSDDRPYTHQFRRWYTAKSMPFMKRFLECVEQSNDGFSLATWDSDPEALVGKLVGIIVQREDYTNRSGEDRARMNVEEFATAADIRAGRYKLPEPKDSREKRDVPATAIQDSAYNADVPF